MDTDLWKKVSEEYDAAKNCLWAPRHAPKWQRNEDDGLYHLWTAYHLAIHAEEKNDILYARVLMMMLHEQQKKWIYDRYHKFAAPAMEAYNRAIAAGQKPTDKELEDAKWHYESLKYELEKKKISQEQYKEACSLIDGLNEIDGFEFHDSKPIRFEHDGDSARLLLQSGNITVAFVFNELSNFEAFGDPRTNWIFDFSCYRAFKRESALVFDIGNYQIICKNIQAFKVLEEA